jgi:single-stranded-DNA-specific exonuclease
MPKIVERVFDENAHRQLVNQGINPLMAKIYAGRGIKDQSSIDLSLANLLSPELLLNANLMASMLADAIAAKKSFLVVGDYDCDGATATALAIKALSMMGGKVDYIVPNRFEYGYGLSPEIVNLASKKSPDILITVDNGIASTEGVRQANALGMKVMITDHHLPGDEIPEASVIVNPNQLGCSFPSKHLAGVGVIFYVMVALRSELRNRGHFIQGQEPHLISLLDLVALGTVADLVKLDDNNRILVEYGLKRIRGGQACPGIKALIKSSGRDEQKITAQDLGFVIGPRINAAGRLDDMSIGIACLLSEQMHEASKLADTLHSMNQERRNIELDMHESANLVLDKIDVNNRYSLSVYDPNWHQGVVGILASRLKERYHRPVIAFADAGDGLLKGSGRSINGLHLRDALDTIAKKYPELLVSFGGHAMAAGVSINSDKLTLFEHAFEEVVNKILTPADLDQTIEIDGALNLTEMNKDIVALIQQQVWGQGFPLPLFKGRFKVNDQRLLSGQHLKLNLSLIEHNQQHLVDAIFFGQKDCLPDNVELVYSLEVNDFLANRPIQLNIRYCELIH